MSNGKHEKKDVNVSLMKPSHETGVNTCYQVTDCSDVSFILFPHCLQKFRKVKRISSQFTSDNFHDNDS